MVVSFHCAKPNRIISSRYYYLELPTYMRRRSPESELWARDERQGSWEDVRSEVTLHEVVPGLLKDTISFIIIRQDDFLDMSGHSQVAWRQTSGPFAIPLCPIRVLLPLDVR